MNMPLTPDHCDLLIRGGHIIDGTGKSSYVSDIGICADRIVAIGDLSQINAQTVINAVGHVVSPGFIDVHTHDDYLLLENPEATPKLSQGVTTVIVGNCGISLSPWLAEQSPPPPLDLLGNQTTYQFPTFASYRTALELKPPAINAAALIGHSTLRCSSMSDLGRPANKKETETMRARLRSSLKAGAIGFSTGLGYEPNRHATPEEVAILAAELQEFDGIYSTHMRDEGDQLFNALDETFDTAQRAKCPVVISHHKCASPKMWGQSRKTLSKIDMAAKRQMIGLDVYPYVASSTILVEEQIKMSKRILVTWSKPIPEAQGKDLSDLANMWNCDLNEAMRRLQPGGGIYFNMEEADVDQILSHPNSMIGSDGLPHDEHPHPRLWGTFPRVLGYYVREKQLFSLEEAVHKMTALSARTFHLADRGLLEPGAFADIVIFDPQLIADKSTFDQPFRRATGINTVLVNGQISWEKDSGTSARAGRLLLNSKVV